MKRYLITGLLIWIPLVITGWVLSLIVGIADQSLRLLPEAARPRNLLGFDIPGAGIVLTLVIILGTGLLATNIIGQRLVGWWEKLLARIPVVNSIYSGVKQVSDTLLSPSGMAFRQPLLVQYPHRHSWTIAFLTGEPGGDVARKLDGEHISVYVPTTPNPTSGFLLMFRKDQVVALDMDVEEALKYIISMGVVVPPAHPEKP
ncbi:MAG: DUF502 domain-containing protein [Candidatus Accumulibacter sp.]|nr:DUF502 domain-containing protein [Accumulibacter sp.]